MLTCAHGICTGPDAVFTMTPSRRSTHATPFGASALAYAGVNAPTMISTA